MNSTSNSRVTYLLPFALVCSLFFLWGIPNSMNGSLIRHFQFALDLQRWKAGLVDSAFYIGYFVFAIPAGLFMQRYGYKRGILVGLLLFAIGAALFYPAGDIRVYGFFLFALFTIASGLAFLETAANLYVTVLGDKKYAEWRINFAQTFNGLAIILGPIIGARFIFSDKDTELLKATLPPDQLVLARIEEAQSVQMPYLIIGFVLLAVAVIFWLTKMPEVGREEELAEEKVSVFDLLKKYRHLALGVLAQFANVGAQATLWGYFVDFKMDFSPDQHVGAAVAYANAIFGADPNITLEKIANYHASFAMILFLLGRVVGTSLMSRFEPRRILNFYCFAAVGLVALAFFTGGLTAIVCLMLTYFCQSIMFPTIFALATKGLPPAESKLASSLVIMAIVGGAVMPPVAGLLAGGGGMKMALLVPFVCFGYVVWYVMRGYEVRHTA
jgi:FHS family L-fucose permease-like MFS transporter